jgi:biopolymer transport protein ExbD
MSEDERQHMTISIRADRDTEMGIINDVKQALRRAGALNINYSATSNNPQKHN